MSHATPIRLVIDPGVFISAALTQGGPPDRLLGFWVAGDLDVVACPHLLEELGQVLRREKFRPLLPTEEADAFVEAIWRAATMQPDPVVDRGATPDPKDDYLPALAKVASVDYLVSGNTRHLPPDPVARPPVVLPAQLLSLILAATPPPAVRAPRRSAQLAAWRAARTRRHGVHGRDPGGRGAID